jgi:hypothetical protein
MIAGRQRLTPSQRALASFLALSLALSQFPASVSAAGHDCTGTPQTSTAAVITAAGPAGAGCTHSVGCGPTVCCTGVTPALFQAGFLETVSTGLTSAPPASNTRVPRLFLGGPPTPPPNS